MFRSGITAQEAAVARVDSFLLLNCAVLSAVSGKRKRQENFQSRKRQAHAALTNTPNPPQTANNDHDAEAAAKDAGLKLDSQTADAHTASVQDENASVAQSLTADQQAELRSQPQLIEPPPTSDAVMLARRGAAASSPAAHSDQQVTSPSNIEAGALGLGKLVKPQNTGDLPKSQRFVVAKPVSDARGHTGYLTFARRSVDD